MQASVEARKMQVTKEEKAATKEKIDNTILNIEKAFVAWNIAQGILKEKARQPKCSKTLGFLPKSKSKNKLT